MAGFDDSPTESEFGFSRPHLIGLGVLSLGAAVLLFISSDNEKDSPQLRKSQPIAVETRTWQPEPAPPKVEPPAFRIPADAKPAIAERTREKFLARKKLAMKQAPAAAPAKVAAVAVAEKPLGEPNLFPNWNHLVEFELEDDLWKRVPTIGMNDKQATKAIETIQASKDKNDKLDGPEELMASVWDKEAIKGLPFQTDSDCKLDGNTAYSLQKAAQTLHREIATIERTAPSVGTRPSSGFNSSLSYSHYESYSSKLIAKIRADDVERKGARRAHVQILQAEPAPVRQELVKNLKTQKDPAVTRLLLDRAVYDLSQDVRHAANEALKDRPPSDFRPELLKALRYPWEAVAWHAAETLLMVKDQEAVPALIDLLDAPDPAAPYRDKSGTLVVRELVKINHMRNCLLCHAPSTSEKDLVRAPIPVPGERLQPVYYGSHRFGRSRSTVPLVRADVTYLRQDFSVVHQMENQAPWPALQRFDYLVRTREVTHVEIELWDMKAPADKRKYSQREAVLAALRSLTHQDLGDDSEAWREALENSPEFSSRDQKDRPDS